MRDNLSSQINSQIPEHLRDTSRQFVAFTEAYYEFVQQRKQAVGMVNYALDNRDIDATLTEFVQKFYDSYGPLIPQDTAYNRRDLLKKIHELYESKGSKKSTALFFRLLYNTDISIAFPQEQMYIASGSRWIQESSFRASLLSGSISFLNTENVYTWSNASGQFSVVSGKAEGIDSSVFEIFFNQSQSLMLFEDDVVTVRDFSDNVIATLKVINTPSRIQILKNGKNFKIGQIFTLKGTVRDTLVRVVDVGRNGELVRAQLLSFGYKVPDSQTLDISPFSPLPVDGETTIIQDGPLTTADFNDSISGISDSGTIFRLSGAGGPDSYFQEDYLLSLDNLLGQDDFIIAMSPDGFLDDGSGNFIVNRGEGPYTGNQLLSFQSVASSDNSPIDLGLGSDVVITPELYAASLASIRISSSAITSYPGRYEEFQGHHSDAFIKLQDSFYYQIYSYVINSDISIERYRQALTNLVHPAGEIFFSQLNIDSYLDIKDNVGVFINKILRLEFDEYIGILESISKDISKPLDELLYADDVVAKTVIQAPTEETLEITDETTKTVNVVETETIGVVDSNLDSVEGPSLDLDFENQLYSTNSGETVYKSMLLTKEDVTAPLDIIAEANSYVDNTYMGEVYVSDEARPDVNRSVSKTLEDMATASESVADTITSGGDTVTSSGDIIVSGNQGFTIS